MEVTVRSVQTADFESVCQLMEEVRGLHQRNRPDIYRDFDREGFRAHFAELLEDPAWDFRVAQSGEKVIGMAVTGYRQSQSAILQPRLLAWMDDLAVREKFRGKGVGKALFQDAQERAANRGADAMELMVWSFNGNAMGFYEKMGMTTKSRIMELPLKKEEHDG